MRRYLILLLFITSSALLIPSKADEVFTVPFIDNFDANTKRDFYTTIDANNDGITIKKHYYQSILPGFYPDVDYHEMEYNSGPAATDADDWFITPKIHLETGKVYSFAFNCRCSYDGFSQKAEVRMGALNTAEAMTTELIPAITIISSDNASYSNEFSVEEEGDYCFGIHVMSERDHGSFYFGDIAIKASSSTNVPTQVSDLRVIADPSGKLQATIQFVAPTQNIDGSTLDEISKIEISCNGKVVKTLTGIQPGQNVEYVDVSAHNGYNDYSVAVFNANGKGLRAIVKDVYIGVDVPLPPQNFILTDKLNAIELSWDAVPSKGENDMVVRSDDVTYYVENLDAAYTSLSEIGMTSELSISYPFNTITGGQDLKRFGVRAFNDAGWSNYAYARMVIGAPYNLPYHESFATGVNHGLTWQEGEGTFFITTSTSFDNDAGCVTFTPQHKGESVSFNLGKMNFKQVLHPVMSFRCKGSGNMVVRAVDNEGTQKDILTLTSTAGEWQTVSVDLTTFVGSLYVIPKMYVTGMEGQPFYIDDINIIDVYDCDLNLSIDKAEAEANEATIAFSVANTGLVDIDSYNVIISINDEEVYRQEETEQLLSGHVKMKQVAVPMPKDYGETIEMRVTVEYTYDLNNDNNTAVVVIPVVRDILGNGDTNAISDVHADGGNAARSYTLDGRKASSSTIIYIKGGRKFLRR